MSNIQGTDLMLVNRGADSYKVTVDDVKSTMSSGGAGTLIGMIDANGASTIDITGLTGFTNYTIKAVGLMGTVSDGTVGPGGGSNAGNPVSGDQINFVISGQFYLNGALGGNVFCSVDRDSNCDWTFMMNNKPSGYNPTDAVYNRRWLAGVNPGVSHGAFSTEAGAPTFIFDDGQCRNGTNIEFVLDINTPATDSNMHSFSFNYLRTGFRSFMGSGVNKDTFWIHPSSGQGTVMNDRNLKGYEDSGPPVTGIRFQAFTNAGTTGGSGADVPLTGKFFVYGSG